MDFDINEKLMALSWKQPYASLMLQGKIETRTWNASYRGWVLICASKAPYSERQLENISGAHGPDLIYSKVDAFTMPLGQAIAVGRLVDSRPMKFDDSDMAFVTFYRDLYSHFYEDVMPIKPFPWKGNQGWKEVTMDIKKQIEFINESKTVN